MSDDTRLSIHPDVLHLWNAYVQQWRSCDRCQLSAHRAAVCHLRGVLPCRVLYVGEAPGESEDLFGYPFIGPAGRLLDSWLAESDAIRIPSAFTNVVGCIPYSGGEDAKSPPKKAIKTCEARLVDIIAIGQPKTIVVVGNVAEQNLPNMKAWPHSLLANLTFNVLKIPHPSAVLKARGANQAILAQKAMLTLEKLAEQHGVRSNA